MDAGRLHHLARVLRDIATEATSNADEGRVAPALVAVVEDISHHPGTTAAATARRTGIAQSQISTTVARLRAAGVIEAAPDPADRRRQHLTVTPTMRTQLRKRGARSIAPALRQHLPSASAGQLRQLEAQLERVAALLLER